MYHEVHKADYRYLPEPTNREYLELILMLFNNKQYKLLIKEINVIRTIGWGFYPTIYESVGQTPLYCSILNKV